MKQPAHTPYRSTPPDRPTDPHGAEKVVAALRQIVRTADRQSKRLARETGLTAPQLLVLQTIARLDAVSIGRIANEVNLTQATVTVILDGLVKRGFAYRQRSETDKRMVHAVLTESGTRVIEGGDPNVRHRFLSRFDNLEEWERTFILAALQRVIHLMDDDDLVIAPLIDPSGLVDPAADALALDDNAVPER